MVSPTRTAGMSDLLSHKQQTAEPDVRAPTYLKNEGTNFNCYRF